MSYKSIAFQKMDKVGVITLHRPDADNTIDVCLAEELADVCDNINFDEETKVVIITGAGDRTFCAGTDPEELSALIERKQGARLLSAAVPLAELRIPVIAAINGDALGQGLELALACDLRIAVETAHFALTHITAGLIPWDGATQRLPRIIGKAKAMEMIITGKYIDAQEAHQLGLISSILPAQELLPTVLNIARTMVSQSSIALQYAKEALLKGVDLTLEQGLRLESDLYFLLQTTEDRTEGIQAFLEKRKPKFKGR
ncbi:enoyl-CoA hydratase/isomerase family protein [Chloroflexota bacterium]